MSMLPSFNDLNIIVVGDVMVDRYLHGDTSRISPEAPVQVVRVTHSEERPGGAGNVALNLVSLGAKASLFSMCGDDEAGWSLREKLQDAGVAAYFDCPFGAQTILKQRVLSLHQQLIRLDFETPYHEHDFTSLLNGYRAQLPHTQAVIFSDYGKGMATIAPSVIEWARHYAVPVIIDPKGTDFNLYRGATVLTPNYKEFEAVVGVCRSEAEIKTKALQLIDALDIQALLVTRGAQGMSLFLGQEREFHLPAHACEVYDVTGAGDTVAAVLTLGIAAGKNLCDAAVLANIAGGIVVEKLGAATVSASELAQALLPDKLSLRGVVTEAELMLARQAAKACGERVVMTNGCFDLLHAGHVAYLEEAKRLGDRLIVAVNEDASVAQLKGQSRPVNSLVNRMAVLSGLSAVDWVVPFSEETPERLISTVLPDVLVKGGDYQIDNIAGAKAVIEHGGEVKILQFVENCSTTKMIQKIREIA
jgi:D-beta-D-heptose 7-phosphate kinase/D-beta-D-heptose 1-phosphate adenosyltransferase